MRVGLAPIFCFCVDCMELERTLERVLEGLGYELVELEQARPGGLLRVFIDRPQGITLDDCERVSNHLVRLFAVEGVDYSRLEVSSPGLDRLLRKSSDFERFAGQPVSAKLRVPRAGKRNFQGILQGLFGGAVRLEVDGEVVELPLESVARVRLVPVVETRRGAAGRGRRNRGEAEPRQVER